MDEAAHHPWYPGQRSFCGALPAGLDLHGDGEGTVGLLGAYSCANGGMGVVHRRGGAGVSDAGTDEGTGK